MKFERPFRTKLGTREAFNSNTGFLLNLIFRSPITEQLEVCDSIQICRNTRDISKKTIITLKAFFWKNWNKLRTIAFEKRFWVKSGLQRINIKTTILTFFFSRNFVKSNGFLCYFNTSTRKFCLFQNFTNRKPIMKPSKQLNITSKNLFSANKKL